MRRPILWLNLFFVIGIIGGQYISTEKGIALFSVILIAIIWITANKFKMYEPLVFIVFSFIGFISIQTSYVPKNAQLEVVAQNNGNVEVIGTVDDIKLTKTGNTIITVRVKTILYGNDIINENIKLNAVLKKEIIHIGNVVNISGKLSIFSVPSNPGGFDEMLYMKSRGFDYNMYVENIKSTLKFENNINHKLYKLREKINSVYDNIMPENEAGILKAMITGDKEYVTPETKKLFKDAGISHIIAISGLHISILSLIIFKLLNNCLNINARICSIVTMAFLIFYMVFTGSSTSTVRAVIMSLVILFGKLIFRDGDTINSISLAMVIILIFEPLYLWDIGFQLSFVTVTAVVCVGKRFKSALVVSTSAWLSSFPLTAYYFYTVPLLGVIINIIILPFISIVVGLGMAAGVVGLFFNNGAVFLSGIVYVVLNFYIMVCTYITKIHFAQIYTGRPDLIYIVMFYLILICIYFYKENKSKMLLILSTQLLIVYLIFQNFIIKDIKVAFLDVGQGDSSVISKDNKTFVIDGGGRYNDEMGNSTGKNIVIPYINYTGSNEIDYLFITHFDSDHALGAIELLDFINVKNVVISDGADTNNKLYVELIERVEKYNVKLCTIKEGEKLEIDSDTYFQCVYPFETLAHKDLTHEENENNRSLVMKFVYNQTDFLFTGDIEDEDEERILKRGINVSADIIKIAHHGSKFSSTNKFLYSTHANIGIISSGKNNVYGHPDKETLERLYKNNIEYYNTANNGGIIIKTNGTNYNITVTKKGK